MAGRRFRVLVVDDFKQWRRWVISTLQKEFAFDIVGQASDGLEAVEKAQQLQPDLIVLDIGLPSQNGIEAARQIGQLGVRSRVLFASENRSWDLVAQALATGALGYLVKSDGAAELLPACMTVIQNGKYISSSLFTEISGSTTNLPMSPLNA